MTPGPVDRTRAAIASTRELLDENLGQTSRARQACVRAPLLGANRAGKEESASVAAVDAAFADRQYGA